MKALRFNQTGSLSELRVTSMAQPVPQQGEVLVKVRAAVAIASTGDMKVSFDLVDFYHREGRLFWVDTPLKEAVRGGAPGKALEITGWSAVTAAVTADRSAD
jgi:hypothetical protein